MTDRRLEATSRRVAEAILPDAVLARERATSGVISPDSTIRPDAIVNALPWQVERVQFNGAAVTGTSLGGIYDFPQGGRIRRISAYARVAPTTGPFTFRLVINGVPTDFAASIQPGTTAAPPSGENITVPPGGVVTLNVTSAGGAEDVTVSVFYVAGADS